MLIFKTQSYNKKLFFLLLILWVFATLFSYFCAFYLDTNEVKELKDYIDNVKNTNRSYTDIFKNGVYSSLKFTLLMFILIRSKFTFVLSFVPFMFRAFCIGFTTSIFIKIYFLKGLLFSLCFCLLSFLYAPIYFMMIIKGCEVLFLPTNQLISENEKSKMKKTLVLRFGIFFLCLSVISAFEALVFKLVLN